MGTASVYYHVMAYNPVTNERKTATTGPVAIQLTPPSTNLPTCTVNPNPGIVGQAVTVTASGGTGTYSWSAPGAFPNSGTGATFQPKYSAKGTYTITLTSGTVSVPCRVTVQ